MGKMRDNKEIKFQNMKKDSNVVSVIIPTIGRSTLKETEAGLKIQTRVPDEIIVIEDTNRRGPSWARDEGVKRSKGDLIVFIDDDCIPENDWLECFIKAIEEHNASMVSSSYVEVDPLLREIRQRRNFPTSVQINPVGFVGIAGNVIFRRECLEECFQQDGFIFDPIFGPYGSEDIELPWRLRKRGHKLVFIDNKLKHLKTMTAIKYLKQHFKRGIGVGILYQLRKKTGAMDAPDRSLLWDENSKSPSILKWISIVWKKTIGPFDYRSFSSFKRFAVFWAGEKAQSFGFLFYLLFKRKA